VFQWVAVLGIAYPAMFLAFVGIVLAVVISLVSVDPGNRFYWEEAVPFLVPAALYSMVAYGLARTSRVPYVGAVLLSLITILRDSGLAFTADAFAPMTVSPGSIVVAVVVILALAASWRNSWQSPSDASVSRTPGDGAR
jgi:hypothetical protein